MTPPATCVPAPPTSSRCWCTGTGAPASPPTLPEVTEEITGRLRLAAPLADGGVDDYRLGAALGQPDRGERDHRRGDQLRPAAGDADAAGRLRRARVADRQPSAARPAAGGQHPRSAE